MQNNLSPEYQPIRWKMMVREWWLVEWWWWWRKIDGRQDEMSQDSRFLLLSFHSTL